MNKIMNPVYAIYDTEREIFGELFMVSSRYEYFVVRWCGTNEYQQIPYEEYNKRYWDFKHIKELHEKGEL